MQSSPGMTTHWRHEALELLPPDRERALAREYRRTGSREIEDRLVRSQLRLVIRLANEYGNDDDSVEDLTQEGALGLLAAVRRFDPARGVRLSTYAGWWIRAYQLRWLVRNHRLVRIGKTAAQRRIFFNARGLRGVLESAGVQSGDRELARRLGVGENEVSETLERIEHEELSLDQPSLEDGQTRLERLADDRIGPELEAEQAELHRLFDREASGFRASLKGRDRALFEARWLGDSQPTLASVGERFGVSRERARQLEQRILGQLRARLSSDFASAA
jgi:RNA polymerase sigma-32 factor